MAAVNVVYDSGYTGAFAPGLRVIVLQALRMDLGTQTFNLATLGIASAMQIVGFTFMPYNATTLIPFNPYGNSSANQNPTLTSTGTTLSIAFPGAPNPTTLKIMLVVMANSFV
jgi:hypothetical protein